MKCLALSRDNLTKILGNQFKSIMYRNLERWAFERNKLFSKLTKIQREKIIDTIKLVNYQAGEVIFAKGTVCGKKVIVVIEGAIKKVFFSNYFE